MNLVDRVAGILSGCWLTLLKWGAIVLTVILILFRVRQDGRNAERIDNLERALENARERRKIDIDTRTLSDDDLDQWLRPPAERR